MKWKNFIVDENLNVNKFHIESVMVVLFLLGSCLFQLQMESCVFNTKLWDHRSLGVLIDSATLHHGTSAKKVVFSLNPVRLSVVAAKFENYITTPQHCQSYKKLLSRFLRF